MEDKRVWKNYINELIKTIPCHLEKMDKVIKSCGDLINIAKQITEDEKHMLDNLIRTRDRLNEEIQEGLNDNRD